MTHVDRGSHRVAYDDHGGEGPAVVFSHSLGLDSRSWVREVARLGRAFRIVTIDTRGHGRSDAPQGDYTIDGLVQDAVAVVDDLGIERFHFVGLSTGGLLAQRIALEHPERVRSIACCNTAARLGTPEGWSERIAMVHEQGMDGAADTIVRRFFSAGFVERGSPEFMAARDVLAATDPVGYIGVCAALRDADLRAQVGSITVPTLVIGATEDVSTPPSDARWLHAHIPGSRLAIIDGAGHVSNIEAPDAFLGALEPFLAGTAD